MIFDNTFVYKYFLLSVPVKNRSIFEVMKSPTWQQNARIARVISRQSVLQGNEVSYFRLCRNYQGVSQSITLLPYVPARCLLIGAVIVDRVCVYISSSRWKIWRACSV